MYLTQPPSFIQAWEPYTNNIHNILMLWARVYKRGPLCRYMVTEKKKKGSEEEEERKIDWCGDQFQLTSIVHLNHLCCINEDRALIMILYYNFNGFGWGKQLKFKSVNGLMLFKVDHWLPLLDIESVEHKLMEIAWHCCVCKLHEMNATYVSHGLIFKGLIAWTSIKTLGRPSWETSFNHLDVDFSVPSHLEGEHNLNRWI